MPLKYRRIIYIFFIALFILSSIWLILYTQGYEYNPYKQKIEKTGALDIESTPTSATIILNGQIQDQTTPTILRRLAPDTYELTIDLPEFQVWEKKLPVKTGTVTFTGNIKLWPPEQLGDKIGDTNNINFSISPNGVNLLYYKESGLGSGLWLLNLASGDAALINRDASKIIKNTEWSATSRNLLLNSPASAQPWQIINLSDNAKKIIEFPSQIKPTIVHWSTSNDNILYISTGTEMYEFSLTSGTTKLLWRAPIVDFKHFDGLIYALVKEGKDGISLKIFNPKNLQEMSSIQPVALSTDFTFLKPNDDWLPLLDTVRHNLYLLTSPLNNEHPTLSLPDVINIDWSRDGSTLLLYNNFELWSYNLEQNKIELINRISTPITAASWFNENYILIAINNELLALELDTRDQQQKWIISKQQKPIQNFFLDPLGSLVTIKTEDGLFRVSLTKSANLTGGQSTD